MPGAETLSFQMFQFHTGSIKRVARAEREGRGNDGFNSILVRLKGRIKFSVSIGNGCFNSILVRLKDELILSGERTRVSFNSILVRLKAELIAGLQEARELFQFHTGSIKRETQKHRQFTTYHVSIPYWFD